ncbi:hypothetical protein SS50377_26567 [Spironucleus salmonicida]|nr:hypothetical protein SS50377_26567 [Spironucleus salmonicida]
MDQKTCKYQKISGICTVFSIKDDEFHANHLIVKMEFQPKLNRQTAADLTSSLTKNYQNLSYDFAIEVGIAEGKQWKCQKLELIEGKCVEWDYEVAWEAATDSQ